MESALEKEKESSIRMALQLLVKDLFAQVEVAVGLVTDEEGEHEVIAQENDAR